MKTPIPANGGAMPSVEPSEAQVASALLSIEPLIADLALMARIVTDLYERMLSRPDSRAGDSLVFHVASIDRDAALFAVGDIEHRAIKLKDAFYAGTRGEEL